MDCVPRNTETDLEMTLSNGTICYANELLIPQCRGLCPSARPFRTVFVENEIVMCDSSTTHPETLTDRGRITGKTSWNLMDIS